MTPSPKKLSCPPKIFSPLSPKILLFSKKLLNYKIFETYIVHRLRNIFESIYCMLAPAALVKIWRFTTRFWTAKFKIGRRERSGVTKDFEIHRKSNMPLALSPVPNFEYPNSKLAGEEGGALQKISDLVMLWVTSGGNLTGRIIQKRIRRFLLVNKIPQIIQKAARFSNSKTQLNLPTMTCRWTHFRSTWLQ